MTLGPAVNTFITLPVSHIAVTSFTTRFPASVAWAAVVMAPCEQLGVNLQRGALSLSLSVYPCLSVPPHSK